MVLEDLSGMLLATLSLRLPRIPEWMYAMFMFAMQKR